MKKIIVLVFVLLFSACGKVDADKSSKEAYQGALSQEILIPPLEKEMQKNKK